MVTLQESRPVHMFPLPVRRMVIHEPSVRPVAAPPMPRVNVKQVNERSDHDFPYHDFCFGPSWRYHVPDSLDEQVLGMRIGRHKLSAFEILRHEAFLRSLRPVDPNRVQGSNQHGFESGGYNSGGGSVNGADGLNGGCHGSDYFSMNGNPSGSGGGCGFSSGCGQGGSGSGQGGTCLGAGNACGFGGGYSGGDGYGTGHGFSPGTGYGQGGYGTGFGGGCGSGNGCGSSSGRRYDRTGGFGSNNGYSAGCGNALSPGRASVGGGAAFAGAMTEWGPRRVREPEVNSNVQYKDLIL
eukprot:TRINITY_DN16294_c0_g1_i1.p1 TRINITY_DN16294_c0_g1~~TRINITY_DN16294_c0_g1_i1.p1  ORF type:complete len:295 (-),score=32.34 TRINITY_DN16294_c0_g1_i1:72-956(-)